MVSADGAPSFFFFLALYLLSIGTALVEGLVFLFFVQDLGHGSPRVYLLSIGTALVEGLLCLLSIGTALVEGLVFLFFVQDLGASNTLCGLSIIVTVVFELPIFSYSKKCLRVVFELPIFSYSKKCLDTFGIQGLLIMAGVCYVTRVMAYTLFSDPWMVLSVEPLHGITFAFKQIAAVHYCAAIAPPGCETSAQGFKDVVVQLGVITGTFGGV
ncbi:hypothetical protein T484DRAFT_1813648 [Baffinella frigidus]|nr:hypothetical protein T484DRAFT_1813648 [Cryptophyta sp. CCMP2293]